MRAPTCSAWERSSTRWRPGKTPFAGGSTAEVFVALLRENPPPVSTVNPAMPKQLDPIVAKLLAKDPAQRYASAEELQEDLETLDGHASRGPSGRVAAAVSGAKAAAPAESSCGPGRLGSNGRWAARWPWCCAAADCRWAGMVEVPARGAAAPLAGVRRGRQRREATPAPKSEGLDHPGGFRQPHRRSGL